MDARMQDLGMAVRWRGCTFLRGGARRKSNRRVARIPLSLCGPMAQWTG